MRLIGNKYMTVSDRIYLVERGIELKELRRKAKIKLKDLSEHLDVSIYVLENLERGRQRCENIIFEYVRICEEQIKKNKEKENAIRKDNSI